MCLPFTSSINYPPISISKQRINQTHKLSRTPSTPVAHKEWVCLPSAWLMGRVTCAGLAADSQTDDEDDEGHLSVFTVQQLINKKKSHSILCVCVCVCVCME